MKDAGKDFAQYELLVDEAKEVLKEAQTQNQLLE
jgi:hypothetical protein